MRRTGLVSVFGCLVLWGCDSVRSVAPVGEGPAKIEAADWEGNWLGSDDTLLSIRVADAEKGVLRLAWVEFDGQSNPSLHTMGVELRESGQWLFANTRDDPDDGKRLDTWLWARIKKSNGQLTIWVPDAANFAPLVRQKLIPGRVVDRDVILDPLTQEHIKAIMSEEHGMLFVCGNDGPATLIRVGR